VRGAAISRFVKGCSRATREESPCKYRKKFLKGMGWGGGGGGEKNVVKQKGYPAGL